MLTQTSPAFLLQCSHAPLTTCLSAAAISVTRELFRDFMHLAQGTKEADRQLSSPSSSGRCLEPERITQGLLPAMKLVRYSELVVNEAARDRPRELLTDIVSY